MTPRTISSASRNSGRGYDEGIAAARAAATNGIIPPRFVLQRVIDQVDGFVADAPAKNPLVATLDERLAELGSAVSAEARAKFVAAAEKEVVATVLPAYRRVRELLAAQLPAAFTRRRRRVAPAPRRAAYARALAASRTTSLTADEIHTIGLREVARIEAEMDADFEKARLQRRFREGPRGAGEPDLGPAGQPHPCAILLAKVQEVVKDAERRSAAASDLRPQAPVTVKKPPRAGLLEASSAAHYSSAAPDGTIPGIYWIPLADLGPKVTWLGVGLKSTAYHEAIPGHHFQVMIQQEARRTCRATARWAFGDNNAYGEGWALYAERLADENGWYETAWALGPA